LTPHPKYFFARLFFTYSHNNAIKAVANKVADGAKVDSLVYDFFVERERDIVDLAVEFSSRGMRACVDIHPGGMSKLSTYDRVGGKAGQPFPLSKLANSKAMPFGLDILHTVTTCEMSTIN